MKINSNKVVASGSIIPSIVDAPLDIRARVNTVNDIYDIELPYVGMIVYVIDEDKYYKIKALKAKEIGGQLIENTSVDTFEEFLITMETVLALQQQIEQLQSTVNELIQIPEIIIANKNIESEMEYLNERTQDENVIGIIIDPYITPSHSYSWSNIFGSYSNEFDMYSTIEFVNNVIIHANKIDESKINEFKKIKIEMREKESQDIKWNFSSIYCNSENFDFNINNDFNDSSFKSLLKKVYNGETELEINYLFQIEVLPDFKMVEMLYSTNVSLK